MNSDLLLAAVAVVGPVLGVTVAKFFEWRVDKKTEKQVAKRAESDAGKVDADAAQVIATTAVTLIAPLQAEIADLRLRMDVLEEENKATKTRLQLAIDYIRELLVFIRNHNPDKTPPTPPRGLEDV